MDNANSYNLSLLYQYTYRLRKTVALMIGINYYPIFSFMYHLFIMVTQWNDHLTNFKPAQSKNNHVLLPQTSAYYRPQRSCGQGYVFTRVCDSVNRGVSASVHAGIPPRSRSPGSRPPQRQTPPVSRPPRKQTPPKEDTPPTRSRHPPWK